MTSIIIMGEALWVVPTCRGIRVWIRISLHPLARLSSQLIIARSLRARQPWGTHSKCPKKALPNIRGAIVALELKLPIIKSKVHWATHRQNQFWLSLSRRPNLSLLPHIAFIQRRERERLHQLSLLVTTTWWGSSSQTLHRNRASSKSSLCKLLRKRKY
jgi:hypothetical protein